MTKKYHITNIDRSALSRISGKLAAKYGDRGFNGLLNFELSGAAGQSFCVFLSHGMNIRLTGFANDYVCKGMAGGRVVIVPWSTNTESTKKGIFDFFKAPTITEEKKKVLNSYSVAGNTILYGATGGELFIRGRVGERFGVRNSGALGVIEGLGDHGCEYMTAGTVICLGHTGANFGAGMTGGLAFVINDDAWLDDKEESSNNKIEFDALVNPESIVVKKLTGEYKNAIKYLKEKLQVHIEETGSTRAKKLLNNFDEALSSSKISFVVPNSEKSNPLTVVEQMSLSVDSKV